MFPAPHETPAHKAARECSDNAHRLYRQAVGRARQFERAVHGVSLAEAQAFFDVLGNQAALAVHMFGELVEFIVKIQALTGTTEYEPERVHELTINPDGTVTASEVSDG